MDKHKSRKLSPKEQELQEATARIDGMAEKAKASARDAAGSGEPEKNAQYGDGEQHPPFDPHDEAVMGGPPPRPITGNTIEQDGDHGFRYTAGANEYYFHRAKLTTREADALQRGDMLTASNLAKDFEERFAPDPIAAAMSNVQRELLGLTNKLLENGADARLIAVGRTQIELGILAVNEAVRKGYAA